MGAVDAILAATMTKDFRGKRLSQFDPIRDLPGSVLAWYDFGALPGAAGSGVRQVRDLSGLGHTLLQKNLVNQPTRHVAEDGRAVARFAASTVLGCTTLGVGWPIGTTVPTPLTMFATVKASAGNTSGSDSVVVGGISTGGTCRMLMSGPTGAVRAYGGSQSSVDSGPDIADGTWHVVAVQMDAASTTAFVDGYMTSNRGSTGGTDGLASLVVGALGTGAGQFLGDIREVLVCQGRLGFDKMQTISAALAARCPAPPTIGLSAAPFTYEDTTSSNGQAVRIFAPDAPSSTPVLVLWGHPQGQSEQIVPNYFAHPIAHACLAQGWHFAASNMHGNDSWGNSAAQADVADLHSLMVAKFGGFPRVVLIGASMGAQAMAKVVSAGSVPNVRGAYFIDGALNLGAMYAAGTYIASINTGFGITQGTLSAAAAIGVTSLPTSASFPTVGTQLIVGADTANSETVTTTAASTGTSVAVTATTKAHASGEKVSDYPAKTAGQDAQALASSSFATRLRFVASTTDTAVSKTANTDQFRSKVAASALESGLLVHRGGHLGGAAANPADVVAFVRRCVA